jgi:eukaryotic-like serine/threonine-protein kinase
MAQDRVALISRKYPDLNASVFSPAGKRDVYLVVVGGAMDREQSSEMRAKALRDGMPGDTYARNFSE